MFGIEQKIERAARKGAAFTAAGILSIVGIAFLTSAAWILLTELRDPLFAATIIGITYLGVAAIFLAVGLKKPARSPVRRSASSFDQSDESLTPLQLVVLSFLRGFEQGRHNKRPD